MEKITNPLKYFVDAKLTGKDTSDEITQYLTEFPEDRDAMVKAYGNADAALLRIKGLLDDYMNYAMLYTHGNSRDALYEVWRTIYFAKKAEKEPDGFSDAWIAIANDSLLRNLKDLNDLRPYFMWYAKLPLAAIAIDSDFPAYYPHTPMLPQTELEFVNSCFLS